MTPIREEIAQVLKSVEFNGVVVITWNMKSGEVKNWWRFDGHPDTWTSKELSDIAVQMSSRTAELLKAEANTGERKVNVQQPALVAKRAKSDASYTNLFMLGIAKPHNPKRRLWLSAWITWTSFGCSLSWGRGVWMLIGPFQLGATVENATGL